MPGVLSLRGNNDRRCRETRVAADSCAALTNHCHASGRLSAARCSGSNQKAVEGPRWVAACRQRCSSSWPSTLEFADPARSCDNDILGYSLDVRLAQLTWLADRFTGANEDKGQPARLRRPRAGCASLPVLPRTAWLTAPARRPPAIQRG